MLSFHNLKNNQSLELRSLLGGAKYLTTQREPQIDPFLPMRRVST